RCGIAEPTLRYRIKSEQWERGPAPAPAPYGAPAPDRLPLQTAIAADPEVSSQVATKLAPGPVDVQTVQVAPIDPAAIADRGRDLVARMLAELDAITANSAELRAAILDATKDDGDGRRRARLLRLIDLPSRAIVLKDLMTAAKTL